MDFFADRMARTMDKLITIATLLDNLTAGVVDLPAERAMTGSYFCPDEGQGRIPSLPDQVENLAKMLGGKNYAKAQAVGVIQGPLATTYSLLTAPMRDFCYVIQARAEQLKGEATE